MAHVSTAWREKGAEPPVAKRVSDLSRRQGGAVSRGQLIALGMDDRRIHRMTAQGWLARVHQGVYRVGTLTPDGLLAGDRPA